MAATETKIGFDPVALNREAIDSMVDVLRDIKAGKQVEHGFGTPGFWARQFGFLSEETINKPCGECGRPKVDHRYSKVTSAGRAFLALAERQ